MENSVSAWVKRQKELLDLELQAEAAQLNDKISTLSGKNCEVEGLSLLSLEVAGTHSELFGRCAVILQKIGKHPLPNGFKVGDEVTLYNPKLKMIAKDDGNELFGVVRKVSQFTIEIVIEEYDERLTETPLRLDKRSSQKTHEKMSAALTSLPTSHHPLVHLLMSNKADDISSLIIPRSRLTISKWFNEGLNDSQRQAITTCLVAPMLGIIHGPPGTGKTSTLVELILQAMLLKQKVLVCAPSNIAVDTILLRLTLALRRQISSSAVAMEDSLSGIIRIGHPARIVDSVIPYTLDYLIDNDDGTEIVRDVRKEIDTLRSMLKQSYSRGRPAHASSSSGTSMTRQEIKSNLRASRKEVTQREREVVHRLLRHAKVVATTCVGAGSKLIADTEFDLVIIDEAAQGLEAACWIPILHGRKVVLAGDHCQLPPTIKSKEAETGGLNVTLFERIIMDKRYESISQLLNVQYRMNDLINQWASRQMYGGAVTSAEAVTDHSLRDLVHPEHTIDEHFPILLMLDTGGCLMFEDSIEGSRAVSHCNRNEAQLVAAHTLALLDAGIAPSDIGIITPYNGQLEVLRELFSQLDWVKVRQSRPSNSPIQRWQSLDGIDIKTIDGFQGGEKECILISLVRSNDRREVGFLGEHRRINVAVTRAKRHLALICDSDTCSHDSFIKSLLTHMEEHGEVIGAEEYLAEHSTNVGLLQTSVPRANAPTVPAFSAAKSTALAREVTKAKPKPQGVPSKAAVKEKPKGPSQSQDAAARQRAHDQDTGTKGEDKFAAFVHQIIDRLKRGDVLAPLVKCDGGIEVAVRHTASNMPSARVLEFPCGLSSFQRMIVHAAAESAGICHTSIGEGTERHVEVSLTAKSPLDIAKPSTEEDKKADDDEQEADDPDTADEGNEDEVLKPDNTSTVSTAASAAKKKSKSKKKAQAQPKASEAPGKAITPSPLPPSASRGLDELDEDALLALAIAENQKLADQTRYRVKGTAPIPNYDREIAKQKLRSKLLESQESRKPTQQEGSEKKGPSAGSGGGSSKKVLKKPVPNFGGGVLGRK